MIIIYQHILNIVLLEFINIDKIRKKLNFLNMDHNRHIKKFRTTCIKNKMLSFIVIIIHTCLSILRNDKKKMFIYYFV